MSDQLSVIIPVYNEAAVINRTLARLHRLPGPQPLEIIVVDGAPDRSTLAAVREKAITGIGCARGRGRQMNRGASLARGSTLLFLHADTLLPEDALHRMASVMEDPTVVGGAFDLGIDAPGRAYRLIETAVALRTRLTRIAYGDQAIFLNRMFFQRLGGFSELPLMEDVALMRRIRRLGYRIAVIPSPVRTSPRRWEKEGILFCTLRNWTLMALYLLGVSPYRLARFYR